MPRIRTIERQVARLVAVLAALIGPVQVALAQGADAAGDHQAGWAGALWILAASGVLVALLRLIFGQEPDPARGPRDLPHAAPRERGN